LKTLQTVQAELRDWMRARNTVSITLRLSMIFAIALLVVAGTAAGQEPDTQYTPGPKPDAAAVARGQQIFLTNCSFCHAADATGASGPDLLRSPLVLKDQHGETIGPLIHNGRPGTAMPAFASLSEDQISDISAFLRGHIQQAANRMVYEIKGLLTGDPKQGETYFNGPGKCNTCHSPTGDLAGIATRYQPPQLLAHIAYPSPLAMPSAPAPGIDSSTKSSVPQVTVTLSSGEKVSGELIHIDEFYVTLRDSSGWDRTFSREDPKVKVDVSDPMAFHKAQLKKYTDADLHNVMAYLETLK
jgi:mono/diheme cytochrome c family protein/small nuclear ribonucleoprotein (snRNP)-like protein